ncbi:nuclear protein MDM1 isoform X6 [Syngnathus typhle]|uniref:nuclear protein MDM1 isoform X6 n=1 Tax=Syngnathus typhle TaxID=161592 RepID=UPI002A6A141D|nr:nuclear protein MDM1 isoform X6 [Syngnathus typhle]
MRSCRRRTGQQRVRRHSAKQGKQPQRYAGFRRLRSSAASKTPTGGGTRTFPRRESRAPPRVGERHRRRRCFSPADGTTDAAPLRKRGLLLSMAARCHGNKSTSDGTAEPSPLLGKRVPPQLPRCVSASWPPPPAQASGKPAESSALRHARQSEDEKGVGNDAPPTACWPRQPKRSHSPAAASATTQVMLLREKARWYRRRAWGTNFSRQHLSQLKSQHNILWEPDGGGGGARRPASVPRAEAQDSASRPREDGEDDKGAGRFPTPEKYGGPLHRSHLDLTTPTCAGGGMLVGRATSRDAFQRRGDPHAELPPEGPAASRPSSAPPPTRVIRGLLRHAEFQHNGELGLRFRSYAAGPLCPDRDVAWSRSLAAAVLERARSRPRQFWGRS